MSKALEGTSKGLHTVVTTVGSGVQQVGKLFVEDGPGELQQYDTTQPELLTVLSQVPKEPGGLRNKQQKDKDGDGIPVTQPQPLVVGAAASSRQTAGPSALLAPHGARNSRRAAVRPSLSDSDDADEHDGGFAQRRERKPKFVGFGPNTPGNGGPAPDPSAGAGASSLRSNTTSRIASVGAVGAPAASGVKSVRGQDALPGDLGPLSPTSSTRALRPASSQARRFRQTDAGAASSSDDSGDARRETRAGAAGTGQPTSGGATLDVRASLMEGAQTLAGTLSKFGASTVGAIKQVAQDVAGAGNRLSDDDTGAAGASASELGSKVVSIISSPQIESE
ncbi:hypothetical protein QJQ45_018533 [Haematococcus lacustris]|nr:hypothetical protein QJQ45_018533 [Haematococcus lacustris]